MKRIYQPLLTVILLFPLLCAAAPVSVHDLRLWQAPDNTRLVFDLSAPSNIASVRSKTPNAS